MKSPGEILMIEDSATDAALAQRAFHQAHLANPLAVAATGEEGLARLFGNGVHANAEPSRPQLILLDLNLPGMSGIEFLRRLKNDDRTRDIPVVVLSLSENDRNIMACVRLGSDGYIIKPLDIDNLIRVMQKLNLQLTPLPAAAGKKAREA